MMIEFFSFDNPLFIIWCCIALFVIGLTVPIFMLFLDVKKVQKELATVYRDQDSKD